MSDELVRDMRPLRAVPLETLLMVWKRSNDPRWCRQHALRVHWVKLELEAREAEMVEELIRDEPRRSRA